MSAKDVLAFIGLLTVFATVCMTLLVVIFVWRTRPSARASLRARAKR